MDHHFSTPKPFNMQTCRFGAGTEEEAKKGNTPGFIRTEKAYFEIGASGFKRLKMKRNHRRVNQTSEDMLVSWRGNCDVQVFVYESDPKKPHYNELARVTDYTVGYACKGGQKLKDEKEQIISLTNAYCDDQIDGSARGLSNKLLNHAATNRFISKPECMVILLGLDLVKCTDMFTKVNINGNVRITKKGTTTGNTLMNAYTRRRKENQTFHEYFHEIKNGKQRIKTSNKWNIPHYTGMNVRPIFPPTKEYSRFIATVHKPWRLRPDFSVIDWK